MTPRYPTTPTPPLPSDPYEAQRWAESARRRRQLDGTWRSDLERRLGEQLGSVRASAWGPISLALNPFASIIRELSVLYDNSPEVLHDDERDVRLAQLVQEAGLWSLMSRVQQYTLGQRECFVRLDCHDGILRYRPAYVDLIQARALLERPDEPIELQEWRLRTDPKTHADIWTVDCFSLLGEPSFRIYRGDSNQAKRGEDMTEAYLGRSYDGEDYPYRYGSGEPFLPYVLYHAQRPGDRLFDPYTLAELSEGSLDAGVLHQMLMHTFRDCSWPQRWVLNCVPAGAETLTESGNSRRQVVTDPASLLVLQQARDTEDAGQALVGQWQAGADVEKLEATLSNIVARLAQEAGVPPSDIQRLGGTARSGVAISLSNEGKRAAQRAYRSSFRASDEQLLSKSASLVNLYARNQGLDIELPESGYRVVYPEIPLSPEERKARREDVFELLDRGLLSRVSAYARLNPGVSRRQAERSLDAINGRLEASDEVRAAREEVEELIAHVDEQAAERLRLVRSGLGHSLRLLDAELAEDIAEAGAS